MRKTTSILLGVVLALGVMVAQSCRHQTQSTNPVVIRAASLNEAQRTVNTIAHGLVAARQTVDALETSEPDYYKAVTPKIRVLANLNESANQCILGAVAGGSCDWQTAVISIAKEAGRPDALTAFGFKNPDTQKYVQVGFAGLLQGLNLSIQFQQKAGK